MSPRVSVTQFEPSLEPHHIELLLKRGISEEFALQSHVRTLMDNEARNLGFLSSIPSDQRKNGLQGLGFEFVNPLNGQESTWRLRPDTKFTLNGKRAKYLARRGDPVRVFFPHITTEEELQNPKIPAVITEGELKTVSIAENLEKIGKRFAVLGLAGVNGGWHREKDSVLLPDGSHQKRSRGYGTRTLPGELFFSLLPI